MAKGNNNRNRGQSSSVNPQGLASDIADTSPKSKLEQRAKTKNTK
ncbi:hypothetical protein [Bacillus pseudomycoides]|nr:hypothetical protein [Bacillus pseudomycoides]EEM02456.1 hypothetical protein bmyco0002_51450 [Bacillus pseudomycoides]KFN12527.1 hypothetical protein DJ94_1760 [Bacillus pseudomycoides]MED0853208.1 hypothetical protein [Bacillus pseudomycoides]MED1535878.1 hypothetical protein [Bacillus pseudomycoides]MED1625348.1 hypothetical protein [Bacillus pseudomycoides]